MIDESNGQDIFEAIAQQDVGGVKTYIYRKRASLEAFTEDPIFRSPAAIGEWLDQQGTLAKDLVLLLKAAAEEVVKNRDDRDAVKIFKVVATFLLQLDLPTWDSDIPINPGNHLTLLHCAVLTGDAELVRAYLNTSLNINPGQAVHKTPFFLALDSSPRIVKLFFLNEIYNACDTRDWMRLEQKSKESANYIFFICHNAEFTDWDAAENLLGYNPELIFAILEDLASVAVKREKKGNLISDSVRGLKPPKPMIPSSQWDEYFEWAMNVELPHLAFQIYPYCSEQKQNDEVDNYRFLWCRTGGAFKWGSGLKPSAKQRLGTQKKAEEKFFPDDPRYLNETVIGCLETGNYETALTLLSDHELNPTEIFRRPGSDKIWQMPLFHILDCLKTISGRRNREEYLDEVMNYLANEHKLCEDNLFDALIEPCDVDEDRLHDAVAKNYFIILASLAHGCTYDPFATSEFFLSQRISSLKFASRYMPSGKRLIRDLEFLNENISTDFTRQVAWLCALGAKPCEFISLACDQITDLYGESERPPKPGVIESRHLSALLLALNGLETYLSVVSLIRNPPSLVRLAIADALDKPHHLHIALRNIKWGKIYQKLEGLERLESDTTDYTKYKNAIVAKAEKVCRQLEMLAFRGVLGKGQKFIVDDAREREAGNPLDDSSSGNENNYYLDLESWMLDNLRNYDPNPMAMLMARFYLQALEGEEFCEEVGWRWPEG